MYIEQLYTSSLSQAAYYIESNGEAAVIDPFRSPDTYVRLAKDRKAVIRYVFETHFHADFVSGHVDLANLTGARLVFGPGANPVYESYVAVDNEEFRLGEVTLKILHTPGHSLESCCLLLLDEHQIPHSVFTGDTLLVGDVGRPDLVADSVHSVAEMAGLLYDSISTKLLPLANYVVVYPGHGSGSLCGKSIGTELFTTIGAQKKTNYAVKARNKQEFIEKVIDGLEPLPDYFTKDIQINKSGYLPFESLMQRSNQPLHAEEFKKLTEDREIILLDSRAVSDFAKGHIPGSLQIGVDGKFAQIAGSVLDYHSKVVLISDEGTEMEVITLLAGIGIENVIGFLKGGYNEWVQTGGASGSIDLISAKNFEEKFRYNTDVVIDVRNSDEWIPGFVPGAKLISLNQLEKSLHELDPFKQHYVYCTVSDRAMTAISILKKHGIKNVSLIEDGMSGLRNTNITLKQLSVINN